MPPGARERVGAVPVDRPPHHNPRIVETRPPRRGHVVLEACVPIDTRDLMLVVLRASDVACTAVDDDSKVEVPVKPRPVEAPPETVRALVLLGRTAAARVKMQLLGVEPVGLVLHLRVERPLRAS